jgi:hypothetical protein
MREDRSTTFTLIEGQSYLAIHFFSFHSFSFSCEVISTS